MNAINMIKVLILIVIIIATNCQSKEINGIALFRKSVDSIIDVSNYDSIVDLYQKQNRFLTLSSQPPYTQSYKDSIAKIDLLFGEIRISDSGKLLSDSVFKLVENSTNEIEREYIQKEKTKYYKQLLGKRITILLPPRPSYYTGDLTNTSFSVSQFMFEYSTISKSYGINTKKCKGLIISGTKHSKAQDKCFDDEVNFRVGIAKVTKLQKLIGLLSLKFGFKNNELAIGFNMDSPLIVSGIINAIEYKDNGFGIQTSSSYGFIENYENVYIDIDSISPYILTNEWPNKR